MLAIIANREDANQTASSEEHSDLGLHCLDLFGRQNFFNP